MNQVFIRKKMAGGQVQNLLIRAEVIETVGDTLRVKTQDSLKIVEVKAADVLKVENFAGSPNPGQQFTQIPKCYPDSQHTLLSRLTK